MPSKTSARTIEQLGPARLRRRQLFPREVRGTRSIRGARSLARTRVTFDHNRWSIHSMDITNMLLQTHRGAPRMVLNAGDALRWGTADHEGVGVFNDCDTFLVPVRLSGTVRPGQVIVCNGWDPYSSKSGPGRWTSSPAW